MKTMKYLIIFLVLPLLLTLLLGSSPIKQSIHLKEYELSDSFLRENIFSYIVSLPSDSLDPEINTRIFCFEVTSNKKSEKLLVRFCENHGVLPWGYNYIGYFICNETIIALSGDPILIGKYFKKSKIYNTKTLKKIDIPMGFNDGSPTWVYELRGDTLILCQRWYYDGRMITPNTTIIRK